MDPNVAFKNFIVAAILLGIVAFAALMFRPGSVGTVGQGGGWSNQGSFGGDWGRSNENWGGRKWGDDDDDWDDDD